MSDQQIEFRDSFKGTFYGILRWDQLDSLWERVREDAGGGWYMYAVGESPPVEVAAAGEILRFVEEVDVLLRKEHGEDYCGVVYADDPARPGFIKIFDPNNLGVSCGYSDNPPLPGWILSKLQPVDLQVPMPQHGNRRRWWKRLFSS